MDAHFETNIRLQDFKTGKCRHLILQINLI
jgi:hypothetical protein